MAKRMAMSDADVLRLLAQDRKEYIEYPPERGDRYYQEDEIDEEALAQMILEKGIFQDQMEALGRQGLAETLGASHGEYRPNMRYLALHEALRQRLVQQGVSSLQASIMANQLPEYA